MGTLAIILGILIGLNIIMAAFNRDINALCGWLVAGLEWSRRLTT